MGRKLEIGRILQLYSIFGMDLLGEGVAVDTAHGNAKGTALEDIVVGEALNQLERC